MYHSSLFAPLIHHGWMEDIVYSEKLLMDWMLLTKLKLLDLNLVLPPHLLPLRKVAKSLNKQSKQ